MNNLNYMKDIPIGEFITLGDETYKCMDSVTEGNDCEYCDFIDQDDYCYSHLCSKHDRLDQRNIIFILYDDSTNEGTTSD